VIRKRIAAFAASLAVLLVMMPASQASAEPAYSVLVFSKTAAFRHSSIPDGVAAIQKLGAEHNFAVDATEDATVFNDADLAEYDSVIWLMTTGDVLNDAQQAAFERYIQAGGGYVGIHSASDTEYDWSWYGGLVGAYFRDHPNIQQATVKVAGHDTAATQGLPSKWVRTDEWYNFRTNPRPHVRVLATLDERTYDPVGYTGGFMGSDHPLAWCQRYDGGRAFYTGLGHTSDSYREPLVLQHILGGIEMAVGVARFNCSPQH
jgi:type 1 glutamine amidotransferase